MSIENEVLDEWDKNQHTARMVGHKDNHFPSVYMHTLRVWYVHEGHT